MAMNARARFLPQHNHLNPSKEGTKASKCLGITLEVMMHDSNKGATFNVLTTLI
jgi:hypothetical protein